jgi:hypothetical protein
LDPADPATHFAAYEVKILASWRLMKGLSAQWLQTSLPGVTKSRRCASRFAAGFCRNVEIYLALAKNLRRYTALQQNGFDQTATISQGSD